MRQAARAARLWQRQWKMRWWQARATRASAARQRRVPARVGSQPLGVNLIGPMTAQSGLGEAARASARTLEASGIPVATLDFEAPGMADLAQARRASEALPHPFTLIHFNADRTLAIRRHLGEGAFADCYTIGYWFWELSRFRADWLTAFEGVDEVWTASRFTHDCLRAVAPDMLAIEHLPFGLCAPEPGPFSRAHFSLPEHTFLFLCAFDASSQVARKNPAAAIEAFRRAAFAPDEAALVLKISRASANRLAVEALRHAAAGLSVIVLEGEWPQAEQHALMACTDACLSLHRSEGFGLTIAEQMLLGKPAVATAYSGNLDFMTPEISGLVPAAEQRIAGDHGPYLEGWTWAEPDVETAARLMQGLVRTPGHAAALGARGQAFVASRYGLETTGTAMRSRLQRIQQEAV